MPKQYSEEVSLPKGLPWEDMLPLARAVGDRFPTKTLTRCAIETDRWQARETSIDDLEAHLGTPAAVQSVSISFWETTRDDLDVVLIWNQHSGGWVMIRGVDETRVVGLAGVVQRIISDGTYLAPVPPPSALAASGTAGAPPTHPAKSWFADMSSNYVAGLLAAATVGVVGLVWAIVQRLN